ncbi:MAG TPA: hypothetical protein VGB55_11665, partial [Tepidisphaeraceae bacterium]
MLSRRVASLCVLTVLTACATAPATEPLQRASCVLRIEFDGNGSSAQVAQTVQAALTSTALVDPSMQAALEMGPAEWPKFVQVDVQPAGDVAVKLGIVVRSTPEKTLPPGSAEKVMREIT